jgi:membrane-bound lytic murein transglycosylase B
MPLTRRPSRTVALPVVLASTVLLATACGGGDGEAERTDWPPAPRHDTPPLAQGVADVTATPVARLAPARWVDRQAERTDVPRRALAAYAGASLRVAETHPGCGLGWNALAAIGAIESVHGSFGGSSIGDDGAVSPDIVGIPLDGSDGVMAIDDTDGGALDGDDEWDRAVGPMQFIPTTWERYGRDGNLDGRRDAQHVDDAALAAAVYLCESGDDLTSPAGWGEAVRAYNNSSAYASDVTARAGTYAG